MAEIGKVEVQVEIVPIIKIGDKTYKILFEELTENVEETNE